MAQVTENQSDSSGASSAEEGGRKAEAGPVSFSSTSKDETQEVALRAQVITNKQHKAIKLASLFMMVASICAFSYSLTFKTTSAKALFRKGNVQIVNIFFAATNVLVLGTLMIMSSYNLILVRRARLRWSRRKRVLAYVALAMLIVQFVNSVFFLVPNAFSLAIACSWFRSGVFAAAFIRWSCWNSVFCLMAIHVHNIMPLKDPRGGLKRRQVDGHEEATLVMDLSLMRHLPALVIWVCFEFCIIYLAAANPDNFNFHVVVTADTADKPCEDRTYECRTGTQYKVLTTFWIAFLFVYVLLTQAWIRSTQRRLLLAPYKDYANVHLMVLQQKRQMAYVTFLGVFTVPILWYTRWDRCNNYFVAWLGLLPLQVIVSTVIFLHAFYFMPMRPGDQSLQHEWLQEFAWLESTFDETLSQRANRSAPHRERLLKEPMFCFETGIKLLLWSELVYYDYEEEVPDKKLSLAEGTAAGEGLEETSSQPKEALNQEHDDSAGGGLCSCACLPSRSNKSTGSRKSVQSEKSSASMAQAPHLDCRALLQTAMDMYDLQHFEVIYEPLLETRVLLSWSNRALVVAFRGTAGMANVCSDVKVWRVVHPPQRGNWLLGGQPLVHKGFLETWRVNGLDRRVISRVLEIVDAGNTSVADFAIYLTGHSLGGALATLAAIDLQRERVFPRLAVYTYGAPRTGNHAFARDYQALVPQTWQIINDRDAVPRSGKFWVLYKRPGQRTLINQMGDIRVRPTTLEVSIHTTGFSIRQHLMASYLQSLWSICASQCLVGKALPGGRQAVDTLAKSPQMQSYFETLGLDLRDLASKEDDVVVLPSLQAAGKDLQCCWGLFDAVFGFLRDLLPVSENTHATLSLIGQQSAAAEKEAHREEHDPFQLANRLSRINSMQSRAHKRAPMEKLDRHQSAPPK